MFPKSGLEGGPRARPAPPEFPPHPRPFPTPAPPLWGQVPVIHPWVVISLDASLPSPQAGQFSSELGSAGGGSLSPEEFSVRSGVTSTSLLPGNMPRISLLLPSLSPLGGGEGAPSTAAPPPGPAQSPWVTS